MALSWVSSLGSTPAASVVVDVNGSGGGQGFEQTRKGSTLSTSKGLLFAAASFLGFLTCVHDFTCPCEHDCVHYLQLCYDMYLFYDVVFILRCCRMLSTGYLHIRRRVDLHWGVARRQATGTGWQTSLFNLVGLVRARVRFSDVRVAALHVNLAVGETGVVKYEQRIARR